MITMKELTHYTVGEDDVFPKGMPAHVPGHGVMPGQAYRQAWLLSGETGLPVVAHAEAQQEEED